MINFVFEKLDKPNGNPGRTYEGVIYNKLWETEHFDVNNIPDEKYVYLIEPLGGIANILYSNDFTKYISSVVLNDIRKEKCLLVIGSMSEGNLKEKDIRELYSILEVNNLPERQILFVQSNYNLKKQFNDFLKLNPERDEINLIVTEHKLETSKESFIQIKNGNWDFSNYPKPPTLNTIDEVKNIKDTFRPYRYLSYNKSLRPDRVALLSLLHKEGLLDYGMISMGSETGGSVGYQPWPTKFDFITDPELEKDIMEWSTKLESLRPMSIEGDLNVDDFDSGKFEGLNVCGYTYAEQYRNVYFQVVTEDVFEADSMFFSQTTYKPIVQLTPIVMFGSPHMIKNLNEVQGFHGASFMDNSYDDEEDNNLRLRMVVEEIKRLCNMSIEDLHQGYYNCLDQLESNQDKMFEQTHSNDDNKLVRYLLKT